MRWKKRHLLLAKVICTHINPCKNCTEYDFGYCKFLGWCEKLYNAGYRKIPEDAVVLTREEYEKLKNESIDKFFNEDDKFFKAEFADMKDKCVRRINKDYAKKVRKETAEKLLDEIDYESNGQTKSITDLFRKKYGV